MNLPKRIKIHLREIRIDFCVSLQIKCKAMGKINIETLKLFGNADDLVDYVALHRFDTENQGLIHSDEFKAFPESFKDIVYTLDFEILLNSVGLFDAYANVSEEHFGGIVNSLKRSNNENMATILESALLIIQSNGLTQEMLATKLAEKLKIEKTADEPLPELYPEIRESLAELEENLYNLMEETDYWANVKMLLN